MFLFFLCVYFSLSRPTVIRFLVNVTDSPFIGDDTNAHDAPGRLAIVAHYILDKGGVLLEIRFFVFAHVCVSVCVMPTVGSVVD